MPYPSIVRAALQLSPRLLGLRLASTLSTRKDNMTDVQDRVEQIIALAGHHVVEAKLPTDEVYFSLWRVFSLIAGINTHKSKKIVQKYTKTECLSPEVKRDLDIMLGDKYFSDNTVEVARGLAGLQYSEIFLRNELFNRVKYIRKGGTLPPLQLRDNFFAYLYCGHRDKVQIALENMPVLATLTDTKIDIPPIVAGIQNGGSHNSGPSLIKLLLKHRADIERPVGKVSDYMPFPMTPAAYAIWQAPLLTSELGTLVKYKADLNDPSVSAVTRERQQKFLNGKFKFFDPSETFQIARDYSLDYKAYALPDYELYESLMEAIKEGDVKKVSLLLDHPLQSTALKDFIKAPFEYACNVGNGEVVDVIIAKAGAESLSFDDGSYALSKASSAEIVSMILPYFNKGQRRLAMGDAIESGRISIVKRLYYSGGVSLDAPSGLHGHFLSAAVYAADDHGTEILRWMLDHGADVNVAKNSPVPDESGGRFLRSPIIVAIREANAQALELLLGKNPDINEIRSTFTQSPPVVEALRKLREHPDKKDNYLEMIDMLLKVDGIDLSRENNRGESAKSLAKEMGLKSVLVRIEQHEANPVICR